MIIVESRNKRYRAVVQETDNGASLALYDRGRPDSQRVGTLVRMEEINQPFHVVLDMAADLIASLPGYPSGVK